MNVARALGCQDANKQTSKQASKQAGKLTSKQASKQTSKQASMWMPGKRLVFVCLLCCLCLFAFCEFPLESKRSVKLIEVSLKTDECN